MPAQTSRRARATGERVVMLAPLPPPITGAAGNNKRILDTLAASGADVLSINTAAPGLSRSAGWRYHLRRVSQNLAAARRLYAARDAAATLYIQPDAGLGAWYTLAQVLSSAMFFRRVVFHHRSFAYVSESLTPMRWMVAATREHALHVFLSDEMSRQFAARYGAVRSMTVSNACFVSREAFGDPVFAKDAGTVTVGHLSNLRKNKGFFECADVFEALAEGGFPARLHLAGPITEPEVEPRLARLRGRWGDRVRYDGIVSGESKATFYRELDVFLFPTTHPQEAQPNVVFEALAAGVPVLATPRAAIPEMLVGENGACSPTESNFVPFAVEQISAMPFDANEAASRRKAIRSWIREEALRSQQGFMALMAELGVPQTKVVPPWD